MSTQTYVNFEVVHRPDGVTTVTLDVPGRPLNVLDRNVMSELNHIIHDLEESDDVTLVVFRSGKESGFLAGADVSAISEIDSPRKAGRLIEDGQLLFQRIQWLPMRTVAVIHGPCLGGGLELALACDFRIARNNSSTKIGLPEIKLGLLPAWGGTQRLPKRVGLRQALSMILTGRHLGASEALRIGLVDAAIMPDDWEVELERLIDDLSRGRVRNTRRRSLLARVMDDTKLGRSLTLRMTQRKIRGKTLNYPALESAVKAIELGYQPGPCGFSCERSEFVKLLATPTCRHLLGLFFARERARSLATWTTGASHAAHDAPIRRVGIVGAGAMGAGIGQLSAVRGFDVALKEIDAAAAQAGLDRIEKLVDSLAKRKGWGDAKKDELRQRIVVSCDEDTLVDCDLVIEAVVEREDVKAEVFRSLDRVVQPLAILASNTSSLSVSKMAESTRRRERVAGLHFFNPVHRMELVEVVRAANTDERSIARLVAFVRALGKTPIVTSDSPGFLVNRVLFPYLGEAVLMVGEGYDVAKIDKEIKRFGMPMGPLELLDQVGLDVGLHVSRSLGDVLPGVAAVAEQLSVMVDRQHLGKKTGAGFYRYKNGKRGDPVTQIVSKTRVSEVDDAQFTDDGLTMTQRRLVYPMIAEAIRCLDESVVAEAWAVDLGMVLGTGFAPHLGGPLHLADTIGHSVLTANLKRLRNRHGDRFKLPMRLSDRCTETETRFFESDDTRPKQTSTS